MPKQDFSRFSDVMSLNKDFHGLYIGAMTQTNILQQPHPFLEIVSKSKLAQEEMNILQEKNTSKQNTTRPQSAILKSDVRINADYYKLKNLVISTKDETDFYLENNPEDNKGMLQQAEQYTKSVKGLKKETKFSTMHLKELEKFSSFRGMKKLQKERTIIKKQEQNIQNQIQEKV